MKFLDLFLFRNVREFVLESGEIVEFVATQEIQKMEKFLEVVLQRRTSEQKFVRNVVRSQEPEELGLI